MLKTMSKFQDVLKMFMLGMLKTMLKYKKTPLHFTCLLKLSGRFHFSSSILHTLNENEMVLGAKERKWEEVLNKDISIEQFRLCFLDIY